MALLFLKLVVPSVLESRRSERRPVVRITDNRERGDETPWAASLSLGRDCNMKKPLGVFRIRMKES